MATNTIDVTAEEGMLLFPENEIIQLCEIILECSELKGKELSVFFCGEDKMAELNEGYRGKEGATDVLSFAQLDSAISAGDDTILGDVVICRQRLEQQAEQYGTGLRGECARLVLHGILHLLGFDHEKTEEEAQEMVEEEQRIMPHLEVWIAG